MSEDRETRIKRLTMRSWRRGMREVDLILGPFAEGALGNMDAKALDTYETLLDENDQSLFAWLSRAEEVPEIHIVMVNQIIETISSRGAG